MVLAMLCVGRRLGVDFLGDGWEAWGQGSGSVRRTKPTFRKVPSDPQCQSGRALERGVSLLPAPRSLFPTPRDSAPRLTPASSP